MYQPSQEIILSEVLDKFTKFDFFMAQVYGYMYTHVFVYFFEGGGGGGLEKLCVAWPLPFPGSTSGCMRLHQFVLVTLILQRQIMSLWHYGWGKPSKRKD